jgi:hypothetical protein
MTVDQLAQCIAAANGNNGAINKCKKDFVDAGGAESGQQGGKVFSDPNGGKVFVTDGGKVFTEPA